MSILIAATEVAEGTYVGYKTRVVKVHVREDGRIMAATRTRGARSGGVEIYEPDGMVRVYNQDTQAG